MPPAAYVASVADGSLTSLLVEAFYIAEIKFGNMDEKDKAGVLMFPELRRVLARAGYHNEGALMRLWAKVDEDGSNTVDFGEFLCLLYLWQYLSTDNMASVRMSPEETISSYGYFFKFAANAKVCSDAFRRMEAAYMAYDADQNRRLDLKEITAFMSQEMREVWAAPSTQEVVRSMFPAEAAGREINFPTFLRFVYLAVCGYSPRVKGDFKQPCLEAVSFAQSVKRSWGKLISDGFKALESDFETLDEDNNGRVSLEEVIAGAQKSNGREEKVAFFSRLEHHVRMVDQNRTGDLNFWEFCYLAFLIVQDGSYHEFVGNTQQATQVKQALVEVNRACCKYNTERNYRVTLPQMQDLLRGEMGQVPPKTEGIFMELKYTSSKTGQDAMDIPRILQFLYRLLLPDGRHEPGRYKMDAQKPRDPMNLFVSLERIHTSDVPKIDPVDPRLVTKIKKLGEGGQGIAYSATYPGVNGELAAKYLRPQALQNPKVVQETEQEVAFMRTLTHPNCHQLIGATLRPEICLLSEICPMGSIFDYYTAKLMPTGKRFDEQTARRLALESASGLEFIHNLRFMHRDIKSLNVFLSSAMTAKVADFGMATADPTSTEPAGTVQWMAPEVLYCVSGRPTPYDGKVDVFSFGILLWELYHCSCPYANTGLDQMAILQAVIHKHLRPRMESHVPKDIQVLIGETLHPDPKKRPPFSEIVVRLTVL